VPEEKEEYYEKFKELVPEVSSKLVEFIVDYVDKNTALLAMMSLQTTYKGKNDKKNDAFTGETFKFTGVLVAEGEREDSFITTSFKVYLTLKNKFLVSYTELDHFKSEKMYYKVFETYDELVNKGGVPKKVLKECSEYLSLNNVTRPFQMLDV
jgi:hypothetical protein